MKFKLKFEDLPRERLEDMQAAAAEIEESYRLLRKVDRNIVGQVLEHHGTFYEFDHYPPGDVYDGETHSQYYYHAHRGETGEHGHFHTFLRRKGMPGEVAPAPYEGDGERPTGEDELTHFVAISMNRPGFPIAMFTTNRWVTGESYYAAEDVIAMIDRFHIDHAYPCLAVNRWITAMIRLFRPQAEALLHERDRSIAAWQAKNPDNDVFEDRDLEITSIMPIDVAKQKAGVERALARVAA